MSAPMKRNSCEDGKAEISTDKRSKTQHEPYKLNSFIKWAADNNFLLTDKVTVGREHSCAQYGMTAVADINLGEILFEIPRPLLLTPETTAINEYLEKEKDSIQGTSGWAPLLIALMFEYNNPESLWRPYLDLVPDFTELDLPMFWSREERNSLLQGSGVKEVVENDLKNIEAEFNNTVLPFITKYEEKFSPVCKDLEFYKKMVAFVLAYSFTEHVQQEEEEDEEEDSGKSPAPVMVPMADILNHVAKNNACLKFEKEAFLMIATKNIKKGEEVYNTYGELANWHLLHMYGFAEEYPNNFWDTVDLSSSGLFEAAKALDVNTDTLLERKKKFLTSQGLYGEDVKFILGVDGILDEDEVIVLLKILCMGKSDFEEREGDEDWESDDEDNSAISLTFDSLASLQPEWKQILQRGAELNLTRYSSSMADDEKQLKTAELSSRQKYATYTVHGQKKLLQMLIDKCR